MSARGPGPTSRTRSYASDWGTTTMTSSAPRRTVLAAALAAAAGAAAPSAQAADASRRPAAGTAAPATALTPDATARRSKSLVDYHAWTTTADWTKGHAQGTALAHGSRPGIRLAHPAGTFDYKDPHTGRTASWEYATWTSPVHRLKVPATELVASWNAHTPPGTWIAVELRGTYTDGGRTPGTSWAAGPPATATPTSGAPPSTTRRTARAASRPTPSPSTARRAASA